MHEIHKPRFINLPVCCYYTSNFIFAGPLFKPSSDFGLFFVDCRINKSIQFNETRSNYRRGGSDAARDGSNAPENQK